MSSAARPPDAVHPLDNPAHAALTGPQAHLAQRRGAAVRFPSDVSPFFALPLDPSAQDWADLARLADLDRTGATLTTAGVAVSPPRGWVEVHRLSGLQLVADAAEASTAAADARVVPLDASDVPAMLALVERTRPGPFLPRTIELGTYLGVRREGELIAMTGERLRPQGWTEISAVCTDAVCRGEGLATVLIEAVTAGIRRRGETPFLHVAASNTNALRLYDTLGFTVRRPATFQVLRPPNR